MNLKRTLTYLVDKVPELPYFIVAIAFVLRNTAETYIHLFSVGFIFMAVSLVVGIMLKLIFKTRRPKLYKSKYKLVEYGFPSLHAMISIGMVGFIYFINPSWAVVLLPVGLFYIYARLAGGYHTRRDVLGGAALGLLLGVLFGVYMDRLIFPREVEFVLATLLFLVPILCSVGRIKEII